MRSPIPKTLLRSQKLTLTLAVVLLVALAATTSLIIRKRHKEVIQVINYSQLYQLAEVQSAVSLSIEGERLTVRQKDGTLMQATVTTEAAQQSVVEAFRKQNVPIEFRPLQPALATTALNWFTPVLTLVLLIFVGWRVHASMSGRSEQFVRAKSVEGQQNVKFEDVAGVDEAKAELTETIEFLRDPQRFGRLGGRAPRGILLSGPPGTGKTLLARAAANEAGVPFLSVSGSSFQEKFVGIGAARVRRLFVEGRKLSPCIIFIDEIDALGRQRGRSNDSASADQDQTLNQLLIELDGFEPTSSIVVIGSTNRPDILDQALTRSGRFDREITVNLAGVTGREAILRVHARGLRLESGLDLRWIARGTPGFSGAELANLMNEAAIAATRENADAIGRKHIEIARDRILMGAERQ
ncbi:MAG TPA: AAA family ATPase, partial [Pyrinomonadaceae bacterium]|nr:AAA family ATPase [Pyrinomonadaceae bacterium]